MDNSIEIAPKVSVILPVYNVENYLPSCIESILKQSFSDIEIIIINDGSTDGSLLIAEKYANLDKRIKVYSQKNKGLGETRNKGISLAKGDYLAFIDSDDIIKIDMIKTHSDVVQCETEIYYDNGNRLLRKNLENIEPVTLTKNDIEDFYKKYYFTRLYTHNAWDKLYKRSHIVNNSILFGDNKKIFAEDNWFQLQLFLTYPKISFVHYTGYQYRQRESSIMNRPKYDLIYRHNNMINNYSKLFTDIKYDSSAQKIYSLLAFDTLIMEMINNKCGNGNLFTYILSLKKIKQFSHIYNGISNLNKVRAYTLESQKFKQYVMRVICEMYKFNLCTLSHIMLYSIYKVRGKV